MLAELCRTALARLTAFHRSTRGNVAMIVALSIVPLMVATGAGVDLSRALIVRSRLAEALDAAGLAVGASNSLTAAQKLTLAQNYFNANYTAAAAFGTPAAVTLVSSGQTITLASSVIMPTTLMSVVGLNSVTVGYSSQVTWGQTKLWVSLVLDNTGSMAETDSSGVSKISALKTASQQLLTILQNAAMNPGDVQVALIPFSKDVNLGTSFVGATWIDWTDWKAPPPNSTPSTNVGPGSPCPFSTNTSPFGYGCTSGPANGSATGFHDSLERHLQGLYLSRLRQRQL
jgi:Flp pilus assembly protein TadG